MSPRDDLQKLHVTSNVQYAVPGFLPLEHHKPENVLNGFNFCRQDSQQLNDDALSTVYLNGQSYDPRLGTEETDFETLSSDGSCYSSEQDVMSNILINNESQSKSFDIEERKFDSKNCISYLYLQSKKGSKCFKRLAGNRLLSRQAYLSWLLICTLFMVEYKIIRLNEINDKKKNLLIQQTFELPIQGDILKKSFKTYLMQNKDGPDLEVLRQADLDIIRRETSRRIRGFTVLLRPSEQVNGMVRKDLLMAALDSLSSCSVVERIEIGGDGDEFWLNHPSGKVRQPFFALKAQESNDRNILPLPHDLASHAVLLLHTDVALSCDDLERGFNIWTKAPDRAVGFFPIHHGVFAKIEDSKSSYDSSSPTSTESEYLTYSELIEFGGGQYNLVSDHALFIHRNYLHSNFLSLAKDVGNNRTCEDFLVSLAVTSISLKPPLGVFSHPKVMRHFHKLHLGYRRDTLECIMDVIHHLGLTELPLQNTVFLGRSN